jgi:DNA invertase Pin-like site-specific DNA recombinase
VDLPRRVALYARASTDDQDYHLSVETQFIILREHAMTLGADVHEEYADTGPASGDRPRRQTMLRDAAGPEHPFEAVLACDDARLSRTAEEWREPAGRLSLASVEVVTVM